MLDGCPGTTCRGCVTLTFDLNLGPTWTNVFNGTSTHDGEQLCICVLKSIRNCRSHGPDKNLTFKCNFDLGPTWTYVWNGTCTRDGEQLCQTFWNLSTIVKVMVRTKSKDGRTHARIPNCHCDSYVSLTASGLDKNQKYKQTSLFPLIIMLVVSG